MDVGFVNGLDVIAGADLRASCRITRRLIPEARDDHEAKEEQDSHYGSHSGRWLFAYDESVSHETSYVNR